MNPVRVLGLTWSLFLLKARQRTCSPSGQNEKAEAPARAAGVEISTILPRHPRSSALAPNTDSKVRDDRHRDFCLRLARWRLQEAPRNNSDQLRYYVCGLDVQQPHGVRVLQGEQMTAEHLHLHDPWRSWLGTAWPTEASLQRGSRCSKRQAVLRWSAEFQIRVAVQNGFTALGMPVTNVVASVHRGKRERCQSSHLCERSINAEAYHSKPTVSGSLKGNCVSRSKACRLASRHSTGRPPK